MISCSLNKVTSLYKQRGAIILLTVTLLLVIVSLVTLYTGKIQSFEHKIILNEQNQVTVKAKSEASLQRVIARLNADKALIDTITTSAIFSDIHSEVYGKVDLLPNGRRLISLTATATSADGLAAAQTFEQVLVYPLVFNAPVSPLLVKGGVSRQGELEIVANPDAFGVGVPLSIWSDASVDFTSSDHHTCLKSEFDKSACSTSPLSNYMVNAHDIYASSANFPVSLSEYLFNIETGYLSELKSEAKFSFSNCDSLDEKSEGFIWVEGDCELDFNSKVGTPSNPVVIVVMNGDINFLDNAVIYGLVCSFRLNGSAINLSVNMHKGAYISGVLVSNYPFGTYNTHIRVVYDQQVSTALVNNNSLQMLARVPGSWGDF